MTSKTLWLTSLLLIFLSGCTGNQQPDSSCPGTARIILETDMGNDIDDAMALDMLYKYMDAREVELLGVMTNKEGRFSAEYIDIMNTWYGYPKIPIGVIRNGADCGEEGISYAESVCRMQNENGEPLFRRSLTNHDQLPEAPTLYRQILAGQPDHSVTIVSVGFSTNLARLLETPADDFSPLTGKELVARKVKLLCTMAGCFNDPDFFEYNVVTDISAAQKTFHEWPTPLVTSPFEVGIAIEYPAASIENDFEWAPMHPLIEGYKNYLETPCDYPAWDLTSVLYAVEGDSFNRSPAGRIEVTDQGATLFTLDPEGKHFYLTVNSRQAEKNKQRFIEIITRQPRHLFTR